MRLESDKANLRVLIGDEAFAVYRTDFGRQPTVWPIIGPSGHAMTRQYPLGHQLPGEKDDHPHHVSMWFAHGGVNGHDFWHGDQNRIVHQGYDSQSVTPEGVAVLVARNQWLAGGTPVLEDRRTVAFGLLGDEPEAPRFIDFTINLVAAHGEVECADTKEGTFGIRVPGTMKVEASRGGRVRNDRGEIDDSAWGRPAAWVDYSGPLNAEEPATLGGVVLMAHPRADLPRCRWHVRGYGLFAANPFGAVDFPHEPGESGGHTIPSGEQLTLRYRAIVYAGEVSPRMISDWYAGFSASESGGATAE